MTRSARLPLLAILLLQAALLAIGIGRDYRLKHEDNNALHATFARSHLRLGLQATRGQNYFYSPETGSGRFYAHHPPGPGLALAAVYFVTGRDGPLVTRATAAASHLLATVLFFGLVRRLLARRREALLAALVFVLLPESAFFGRMLNHEVLVLPAAILLVRACWESLQAEGRAPGWRIAVVAACVWAALAGWAGFFRNGRLRPVPRLAGLRSAECARCGHAPVADRARRPAPRREPGAFWRGCRKAVRATCATCSLREWV